MYRNGKGQRTGILYLKTAAIMLLLSVMLTAASASAYAACKDEEPASIAEDLTEGILDQQVREWDSGRIGSIIKDFVDMESLGMYEGLQPESIIGDIISGRLELKPDVIIKAIPGYLLHEVHANIGILIKLLIIAIVCAFLKNLQTSFLRQEVGEIAFFVCYAVFAGLAALSFKTASEIGLRTIDDMVGFMYASVPILTTLMVSSGGVVSGGAFQPMMFMAAEFTASIIKNVFIPAVFLSTALYLVNNLSDRIQVSKMAGMIRKTAIVILGFIITAFLAALSVQGSFKSVADGVAGKTIKFAISTFIPVIGGYLSDAAGAVVGCTLIIRNAAGIAVMIGLILMCTVPLLKILAIMLLYRFAALLTEPLSEKRIINCFGDIADSMTIILGMVASVAVMFILAVSTAISSINTAAMVR